MDGGKSLEDLHVPELSICPSYAAEPEPSACIEYQCSEPIQQRLILEQLCRVSENTLRAKSTGRLSEASFFLLTKLI